jgi:hypothetical protein
VNRHCSSQRMSAEVEALGMWGGGESRQRHYAKLAVPDGEWMGNGVQAVTAREKRRRASTTRHRGGDRYASQEIDRKTAPKHRAFEGRVAAACPVEERA